MWQYRPGSQGLSVEANMPAEWDTGMQWTQVDNEELSTLGPPRPALAPRRRTSASSIAPRVLIADDYVDAAKSLALVLSIAGLQTDIAMDGAAALARAELWNPHVCVLDLLMPKLDGLEIARRIRARGWITRPLLLALTGRTTAQDKRDALEAGFDHYLTKPADPATIVRIIESYVSGDGVARSVSDPFYVP
jgi:CheY-like chemotaxis protein